MKKPIPLSIVTKISKILAALSILFLVASRGLAPGMLAVGFFNSSIDYCCWRYYFYHSFL